MDNQTQTYVGLAVVAVASYLLYDNWKKKKDAAAVAATSTTSFDGNTPIAGKVQKMVGAAGYNEKVTSSKWVRGANGSSDEGSIAPHFFKVKDSGFSWL
jgi:hypothetical protein